MYLFSFRIAQYTEALVGGDERTIRRAIRQQLQTEGEMSMDISIYKFIALSLSQVAFIFFSFFFFQFFIYLLFFWLFILFNFLMNIGKEKSKIDNRKISSKK